MADYDYIIVGAGSAGGALAARLTENPSTKVLLLEAGAASHPYSRMPLSFGLLINNPAANWCYQSEPEPGPANPPIPVPRGTSLGGSSSINGLSGCAASRSISTPGADGLPGLELARRGTRSSRAAEAVDGDGANGRGTSGPLESRPCPTRTRSMTLFRRRSQQATSSTDYNSEDQEGVVKTQPRSLGRRMSVAHCYIEPAMKRSANLQVVTNAHPARAAGRHVGVEYEGRQGGQAKARETVLSAGGVASPQILELSGIGRPGC